jgi:glycosyltransferase involved in cell wall biosynthesis
MRIVMVTKLLPKSHYSRYLYKGLRSANKNLDIFFYTNKNEEINDIQQVKQVWSSNLYPFQIFREALRDHPDLVHIQHEFNMFGPFYTTLFLLPLLLLLKLAHIKTLITLHAVVPLRLINKQFMEDLGALKVRIPSIIVKIVFIMIYRSISTLASAVIVHDHCFRRELVSFYKASEKKVNVIPLGVDDECASVNRSTIDKWSRRFMDKKVILYFGYVTPRKGLEYLLNAYAQVIKQYQNYVLVIAGGVLPYHKNYIHKIVGQIKQLNISQHVVMTGFVADEEIHTLYELADSVVLPYTYSIASSLALSFAIQHRKPVIATNIGAFREEIEDGRDGLLCPPRSIEALREALIKTIGNSSLREEFSKNLNKKISERSWRNIGKKTYKLYETLLLGGTYYKTDPFVMMGEKV